MKLCANPHRVIAQARRTPVSGYPSRLDPASCSNMFRTYLDFGVFHSMRLLPSLTAFFLSTAAASAAPVQAIPGPTLAAAPLHYSISLAAAPLHERSAPEIVFYAVVVTPFIGFPGGNPGGFRDPPTLPIDLPYRGTVVPPLPSYRSFTFDVPEPEAQNAGFPAFGHARMSASGSSIPNSLAPASIPVPATVWLLGSVTLLPLVRRITGRG